MWIAQKGNSIVTKSVLTGIEHAKRIVDFFEIIGINSLCQAVLHAYYDSSPDITLKACGSTLDGTVCKKIQMKPMLRNRHAPTFEEFIPAVRSVPIIIQRSQRSTSIGRKKILCIFDNPTSQILGRA